MYLAIVFLPLAGALIAGLFGRLIGARASELVTTLLLVISAIMSWVAFVTVGLALAVNINLVAFSHYLGDLTGQVFTMFVLTVAAGEAAIGLAILVVYYRNRGSIAVDDITAMKG